jgi:glycosyltransferase involved in cell wall biosynthesis
MNSTLVEPSIVNNEELNAGGRHAKLRVTYILGSLRDGGTERQVLQLMQHLDKMRFDPSLILMEDANLDRVRGVVENCFVLGIPQTGSSRWLQRSMSLSKAVYLTAKYLRNLHSDLVHAFLPGPCILGGIAARLARVPVIVGSRRSLPSQYRARKLMAGWADSAAFRLAHFNLGNSQAVSSEMIDIGKCPEPRCGTIYNGVDLGRFRPDLPSTLRQRLGWTQGEVIFGMVANFRPCKRHCDFVDAAAKITKRYANARFILAGTDIGTKSDVLRQVSALSLTDKVRVLDSTPSPENVFAALDVYVCASDAEGFSNVLLEAMACGKPVIATRVGGNEEAVAHEISGLLVPPNDYQTLAEAAMRLLDHPALRHKLAAAGRARVERDFSIAAMVGAHEDLYSQLVEKSRQCVPLHDRSEETLSEAPNS